MTINQFRTWMSFLEEFEKLKNAKDFHQRYKKFIDTLSETDKAMALKALLDISFDNFKQIIENINFQNLNQESKEHFLQEVETKITPLSQKGKAA